MTGSRRAITAGVFALLLPLSSLATPEEDYRKGSEAYTLGDVIGAMGYLEPAAEAGHTKAQVLLGIILDVSEYNAEAFDMFKRAADQGDDDGIFYLATMYLNGEAGNRDVEQGLKLLGQGVEREHARSLEVMAAAFAHGGYGMEVDRARAAELYRRAADQGSSYAKVKLEELEAAATKQKTEKNGG